jgi:hypothetical protein
MATQFPITGDANGPVIAGVQLSCHAIYSPDVLRVYVLVTDPQGQNDRATGTGTLYLPDGAQAGFTLGDPGAYSHPQYYVEFGTGQTLTEAQFTQACAAPLLRLSITMPDETGHVTIANDIWVAPTTGGEL